MARRKKGRDLHGILLLDKPAGLTSNRALQTLRRALDAKKAGHTGSLDPFATGLLPLCFGEATKVSGRLLGASKTYQAGLLLGQATDSGDCDGQVIEEKPVPALDEARIDQAMAAFRGEIEQIPPMYSALHHQGKRLYELARAGETVERKPRPVTIHQLEFLNWAAPRLDFRVHCSTGTYVRTLGEDLARALGSCGHLVSLRRVAAGPFDGEDMRPMESLLEDIEHLGQGSTAEAQRALTKAGILLPLDRALPGLPRCRMLPGEAARLLQGQVVRAEGPAIGGEVLILRANGDAVALGQCQPDPARPEACLVAPKRLFPGLVRDLEAG